MGLTSACKLESHSTFGRLELERFLKWFHSELKGTEQVPWEHGRGLFKYYYPTY